MAQQTADLKVNPSKEIIRFGPLAVCSLITGENSDGSVALFELVVPCAQRLAAPAHSHDITKRRSTAPTECCPGLSTEIKSTSVRVGCGSSIVNC